MSSKEMNHAVSLVFVRTEAGHPSTTGVLHVRTSDPGADRDSVYESIRQAITKWMIETEEGREWIEDTHYDFNVGDLMAALDLSRSDGVAGYLLSEGIVIDDFFAQDCDRAFDFDALMFDPDAIEATEAGITP